MMMLMRRLLKFLYQSNIREMEQLFNGGGECPPKILEILDQRLTGEQIRKVLKEVPSGEHLHYKVLQNLNQEN